jgi:uncharacterized protein
MTWWGWEEAVVSLGLTELEPALRRVWAKPIYEQHVEQDHAEQLEAMRRAAADPSDPFAFEEEDIRAIDDPVEAVSWVERRAAAMLAWEEKHGAEHGREAADTDVAKDIRLTPDERQWLAGLLASRQAPATAMSLEMLDGFFTALVIGPELVLPSQYLPVVWGTADGEGPVWDSLEQAEYAVQLMTKHWNAIAARRMASAEHQPIIDPFPAAMPGEEWADGFAAAIQMQGHAWDRMFDDRRADQVVMPILALCGDVPDEVRAELTTERRQGILDQLPATLQVIAAFWRQPDQGFPRREPLRSAKVGRNEPCPCGSGKKFKKCCGATSPQTLVLINGRWYDPAATARDRQAATAPPRPDKASVHPLRPGQGRCAVLCSGAWPGALRSTRPPGPRALKRNTQPRTICSPTANSGRHGSTTAVVNRRQSQQAPRLPGLAAESRSRGAGISWSLMPGV